MSADGVFTGVAFLALKSAYRPVYPRNTPPLSVVSVSYSFEVGALGLVAGSWSFELERIRTDGKWQLVT